jgi:hypothetical protein
MFELEDAKLEAASKRRMGERSTADRQPVMVAGIYTGEACFVPVRSNWGLQVANNTGTGFTSFSTPVVGTLNNARVQPPAAGRGGRPNLDSPISGKSA